MFAYRKPRAGIVGDQAFFDAHFLQRQRIGIFVQCLAVLPEQRPFRFAGALNLPERITAVLDTVELIHGADLSQARQFSPIQ